MKKPSQKLWRRQARLARGRARQRRKRLASTPRFFGTTFVRPDALLVPPERFHLRGTGRQLLKVVRAAAARVLEQRLPVTLDLRAVTSLYPAAVIIFLAELDRIISLAAIPKPITIREPRDRKCREVLKQIGMFALTGDKSDVVPQHRDVVYWRAIAGATSSGDELAPLETIAAEVNSRHSDPLILANLWRGVSEAVSNSVEHAYVEPRADGFMGTADRLWWMFTHLRDSEFTVAVCDLGCGYRTTIRRTIPATFRETVERTFGKGNRDAQAIVTAMEYGNSGTGELNRGRGSRDALALLLRHGQGELFIASNTGVVVFKLTLGEKPVRTVAELDFDLRGTIIWWKLPLPGSAETHHAHDQHRS